MLHSLVVFTHYALIRPPSYIKQSKEFQSSRWNKCPGHHFNSKTKVSTFPMILHRAFYCRQVFYFPRTREDVNLAECLNYNHQLTFFKTKSSNLMNWTRRFKMNESKFVIERDKNSFVIANWRRCRFSARIFSTLVDHEISLFAFFSSLRSRKGLRGGRANGSSGNAIPQRKVENAAPSRYVKRWKECGSFYLFDFYENKESSRRLNRDGVFSSSSFL